MDWMEGLCLFPSRYTANPRRPLLRVIPPSYIVASMKDDEYYTSCVAEIKLRYQKGILSKEDIAPFEYLFPSINLGPEIHL